MEEKKIKDRSTLSIILGVIGIFLCATFLGIIPAGIGLYFSISGLEKNSEKKIKYIISIVLCAIALLFSYNSLRSGKTSKEGAISETAEIQTDSKTVQGDNSSDIQSSDENSSDNSDSEPLSPEEEKGKKQAGKEAKKKEKAKKKKREKKFRESCEEYNYKDVLRNPDDYVGKKVKVEVKISSVHNESWLNSEKYYFARSREDDDDDYFWGDEYAIIDARGNTDDPKLLDDDVIMVYGTIVEPEETTSLILNSEELFCIDMKYVDLLVE